jgi:hypothetical protein
VASLVDRETYSVSWRIPCTLTSYSELSENCPLTPGRCCFCCFKRHFCCFALQLVFFNHPNTWLGVCILTLSATPSTEKCPFSPISCLSQTLLRIGAAIGSFEFDDQATVLRMPFAKSYKPCLYLCGEGSVICYFSFLVAVFVANCWKDLSKGTALERQL